jgi:hypothetical protein
MRKNSPSKRSISHLNTALQLAFEFAYLSAMTLVARPDVDFGMGASSWASDVSLSGPLNNFGTQTTTVKPGRTLPMGTGFANAASRKKGRARLRRQFRALERALTEVNRDKALSPRISETAAHMQLFFGSDDELELSQHAGLAIDAALLAFGLIRTSQRRLKW